AQPVGHDRGHDNDAQAKYQTGQEATARVERQASLHRLRDQPGRIEHAAVVDRRRGGGLSRRLAAVYGLPELDQRTALLPALNLQGVQLLSLLRRRGLGLELDDLRISLSKLAPGRRDLLLQRRVDEPLLPVQHTLLIGKERRSQRVGFAQRFPLRWRLDRYLQHPVGRGDDRVGLDETGRAFLQSEAAVRYRRDGATFRDGLVVIDPSGRCARGLREEELRLG